MSEGLMHTWHSRAREQNESKPSTLGEVQCRRNKLEISTGEEERKRERL